MSDVVHLQRSPDGRAACGRRLKTSGCLPLKRTATPLEVTCQRCRQSLFFRLALGEGDLVQLRPFEEQPREKCRLAGPSERGMYIGFIEPKPRSRNDDGMREFHAEQIETVISFNPEKERVTS
jgi:hypothetical protein